VQELFCNVALQGYLAEEEPDQLPLLETFARAALYIRPERMAVRELERMDDADQLNYAWYEFRLHGAAIEIWQAGGRELLRRMYDRLHADSTAGVTTDMPAPQPGFQFAAI
jgi:hypothetical protein